MQSNKRYLILLRNTLVSASSGVTAQVLALITFPLLIKQVGTEDYGIFSLTTATVGYFAIFNMAARSAVVKFTAEFNEKDKPALSIYISNAFLINLILGVIISIILAVTAIWCDLIFALREDSISRARYILLINAAVTLLSQPISVYVSFLYGLQRYTLVALFDLLWTLARNITILLMYIFNGSVFWLVWEEAIMQLLKFSALKVIVNNEYKFLSIKLSHYDLEVIKVIFKYGGMSILYTLAHVMIYQGSMIVTGIVVSVAAITYLQIAYKLFNIINSIALFLCSAVLPSSSAAIAAGDNRYIINLIKNGLRLLLSIILPVTIVIYLFGSDIIRIWIGSQFAEKAGSVSRILLSSWYLYCPAIFLNQIYFGQKDIAFLAGYTFIGALFFTIVSTLFGHFYGLKGIVWACSLFYFYTGIIAIIAACKKFNLSFKYLVGKAMLLAYKINLIIFLTLLVFNRFSSSIISRDIFILIFLFLILFAVGINLTVNAKEESLLVFRHLVSKLHCRYNKVI